MKSNHRLDSIDILKGITILLVVIGHFCPTGSPPLWVSLRDIIYSFHMPLFMMISGYLYASSSKIQSFNDYSAFIYKKLKRLVVPYLAISVFILIVKSLAGRFVQLENPIPSNWPWHLFLNPMGGLATFLWFIYTLFIIFLIYPLITLKLKNSYYLAGLFLILFFLKAPEAFSLNLVFKFIFYFHFGVLIFRNSNAVSQKTSFSIMASIIFFIVFLIKKEGFSGHEYLMNVFVLILALSGSLALWSFVFIDEALLKKLLKPFVVLGVYSAPIYLLHTAAMSPAKILLKRIYVHNIFDFCLSAGLIILMGVLIPILITKFILSKNRMLSLIFLGQVIEK